MFDRILKQRYINIIFYIWRRVDESPPELLSRRTALIDMSASAATTVALLVNGSKTEAGLFLALGISIFSTAQRTNRAEFRLSNQKQCASECR